MNDDEELPTSELNAIFINEKNYAYLIRETREKYPDLSDRVKIETDWNIIEEICAGLYSSISERVEQMLFDDMKRIKEAKLW